MAVTARSLAELSIPNDQKVLKAMIERRHPDYDCNLAHWDFLEATYQGGRDWFDGNVFRYLKEGDQEHKDRLKRAYRFNHTREVVDLVNKYIFKGEIIRNTTDAPQHIKDFWVKASRSGLPIDEYMKLVSQASSTFGRIWVFVDNNKTSAVLSIADQKAAGARSYSYFVRPQDVLDISRDEFGAINWMLVRETFRDDANPFYSQGGVEPRYRLWTPHWWALFRVETDRKNKFVVVLVDYGNIDIGVVPCFPVDHVHSEDPYTAQALITDIAYLDRACANYLSNLDAIIQDQTFSQLAMPAQNLMPGDEVWDKLKEMGTKRVFLYDGEGGIGPEYLSPDVKQAAIIVQVVNKIIGEIYHTVGMAGERTKQDNVVGIDNSSGVAKAYDFERLNSLLASKADSLENAEDGLVRLVGLWNGVKPDTAAAATATDLIKYPDNFDVRSLYDEFDVATQLALIEAPDSVRQEQMKALIDKLFPRLAKELKDKMLVDLKSWPPEPVDRLALQNKPPVATYTKKAGSQGAVSEQEQKTL